MKRLTLFVMLLFATSAAKAQQAGQLYITSYDDTGQIVYVCDGQPQGSVNVQFAMINLNQSVPLMIDSIVTQGDTTAFQYLQTDRTSFTLAYVFVGGEGSFTPSHVGDDTIHETVYYNGQFTATASIVFHARNAPSIAMYGNFISTAFSVGGNSFGSGNDGEVTDTMHDQLTSDEESNAYRIGDPTTLNGGKFNLPVILRSCGGVIIDSINELGNFSEFSFDSIPQLPFTMPDDDSLVLNYEFTPRILDEDDSLHHYLIFHTTDGYYLTWSFEYSVYPTASVNEALNSSSEIKVFPNPATAELQILGGLGIGDDAAGTVHLFDIMGRERMTANDDGTGATLDVSHLEDGTYFLRLGNQSTKVEINR